MLLEIAIGDAYGAGFEYTSPRFSRENNNLSSYVTHPRHRIEPGCYTDDTQMSIAVAEAIVEGIEWAPVPIAQKFVDAFKRDPREGYAGSFHAFLKEVVDGADFVQRIRPESEKSGAAMRAAPLGIFPTIGQVIERTRVQARLTHDTPLGTNAAIAAALLCHYFVYDVGPKSDVGEFLVAHVPGEWNEPWKGKVEGKGFMSVRAAITAIQTHPNMQDLLKASVAFGGDVDTVAAIALGPASCCREIEQDLPQHLVETLENGQFGRDYLMELDGRLLKQKEAMVIK